MPDAAPEIRRRISLAVVVALLAVVVGAHPWATLAPSRAALSGAASSIAAGSSRASLQQRSSPDAELAATAAMDLQDRVDGLVVGAMRARKLAGAVVVVGRRDGVILQRAYGDRKVAPRVPMTTDTLFDLASLTKVVATTTAVMRLWDAGLLDLDEPVSRTLRVLDTPDKRGITPRMLLTHTSGLPADTAVSDYRGGIDAALRAIARATLGSAPGEQYRYSDAGFIVLGALVGARAGRSLGQEASDGIFESLGMEDTMFAPPAAAKERCAPTEGMRQGLVHDPRAEALGGMAGHAGLFSTASDLSRLTRMLLGKGRLDGARVLSERAVDEMLRPQGAASHPRALGWDVPGPSAGFAHGGFTGTYLWLDPARDLFLVFLSSRLHPDGGGRVVELTADIRAEVLRAWEASRLVVPRGKGGTVLNGIDVLRDEGFGRLRGARVALVANRASRARDGTRTIDLLARAPGVELVSILTPEHGIGASGEAAIGDGTDASTGISTYSLYGARYRPTPETLRGADTIVFDLQDAGARYYTYLGTLRYCAEAAAAMGMRLVVLDRPNPGGGNDVEGPFPDEGLPSLLRPVAVPVRHGMTLGELALAIGAEVGGASRVDVVAMRGWERWMRFGDTDLAWWAPSPSLRDPDAALLYPGLAWFETTNVSVGRGTGEPFHVVGAPWMDERLAARLADGSLGGVEVGQAEFVPRSSEHAGVRCRGIRLLVRDRSAVRPVRLAWAIGQAIEQLYGAHWRRNGFTTLAGNSDVARAWRESPHSGQPWSEARERDFERWRGRFLLYGGGDGTAKAAGGNVDQADQSVFR